MKTVKFTKMQWYCTEKTIVSANSSDGAGAATGHQETGGLENVVYIPVHSRPRRHVLIMQFVQGGNQVPPGLLAADMPMGEVAPHEEAEICLIFMVVYHVVGEIFIMRIGIGVSQVMGEFPQGIILPDSPTGAALKFPDFCVDVVAGICIIVPPQFFIMKGAL